MTAAQRVTLEYGDGLVEVEVPEGAVVVEPATLYQEPAPPEDPVLLTRRALAQPLGSPPLRDLVGPGSTVLIAFPDRVKGGAHPTAHRRVTLPLLLEELESAGVRRGDITLLCANGLHRKNTRQEMEGYLGRDLVQRFPPSRLLNHDAEDPDNMVRLGETDDGDAVEVNRRVLEADLVVVLGHTLGNPYGGYSGGYKMPCTGLTGWRSIRCHHTPATLFRNDFVPISPRSHFRSQLRRIGEFIERHMKQPFFAVDAVLNGRNEQLAVFAGRLGEVEQASWPLARQRTEVTVPGEPADVLVLGIPRNFHYGPGMGSNPLLFKQAIAASLARAYGALQPYPVVVAFCVCDGWFNDEWFPPYREVYELLQRCCGADELARYEDEVCTRAEWVRKYRHAYGYHPFHAFSMAYLGALADRYARAVYLVGAREPSYARGMGCIPVPTFEAALEHARRHVGSHPRLLVIPRLSRVQVHLFAEGAQAKVTEVAAR
ncbi:MAG: lactate racemase domain-containing protein [Armatimonadota bacterium]|nr:lactate racemase domain-containing protein [Armatimonadota bacterium]MDR7395702.1 lactate racemase domain-containing protein [Armatimonadota bacterium]MDR7407393.1 lactate racemase domain-containing protein [Armatimonadota bacterium]MDR7425857.1 lactate racemase domain-containing protein [Armatimonadota bacterium]MDR7442496.1 lactate racemase domain-containing protein [Armatimonadota bacterium]